MTLPYYGVFDDLAFRVNGGTVTLLGAVAQPVLKSDAEKAVKRVEGVTRSSTTSKFCLYPRWTIKFAAQCIERFMATPLYPIDTDFARCPRST